MTSDLAARVDAALAPLVLYTGDAKSNARAIDDMQSLIRDLWARAQELERAVRSYEAPQIGDYDR